MIDSNGDLISCKDNLNYYHQGEKWDDGYILYSSDLESSIIILQLFDQQGTIQNTKEYPITNSFGNNSWLYLMNHDLINLNRTDLTRYDEDRSIVWSKDYDQQLEGILYLGSMVETPDGIILVGRLYKMQQDIGIVLKVDKETGDIIWKRTFGGRNEEIFLNNVYYDHDEIIVTGIRKDLYKNEIDHLIVMRLTNKGKQINSALYKIHNEDFNHMRTHVIMKDHFILYGVAYNRDSIPMTYLLQVENKYFSNQIYTFDKQLYRLAITLKTIFWYTLSVFIVSIITYFSFRKNISNTSQE